MRLFQSMAISASALTSERLRLDMIANNVANQETTRTPEGGPYRRRVAVFAERLNEALLKGPGAFAGMGVEVAEVRKDPTPGPLVYDPTHPDADGEGYVEMPNVNIINEMVDMMSASRAYEANLTVLNAAKDMVIKALEIGRG